MNFIFISHRGNTNGPNKESENKPSYIDETMKKYDVEIDVWFHNGEFYLGHDYPKYKIEKNWLIERKFNLWCHAKNSDALFQLLDMEMHVFWHNEDDYTITSKGYIWAYPGKVGNNKTISVMPEYSKIELDYSKFAGICSDHLDNGSVRTN